RFENLTMLPLLAGCASAVGGSAPDYIVLDDALASGAAVITEASEQGSVPELRFVNRGAQPTLIVDGEELVGAKQNRVVNLSILVAAQSELTIPVSCVEAGRWRARTRDFQSSPRTQYASGRAKRMAQVSASIRSEQSYRSDQSAVWADIAAKSARMHAGSPTSAMEALYVDHSTSIEKFVDACRAVERQVGALFAVNGALVGMDLFDRDITLRKMLPKLVRSVAVDALDGGSFGSQAETPEALAVPFPHQVARFLAAVASVPQTTTKGIGLGDDVRMNGSGITGAALVVDGTVIHLSAFNQIVGA
ncbi:MAG TPA: DUF6569 family protein, partial [Vicinamibacterales bacterium]|nr:DUF6569 family protein [Vicinamibacterales bacterium]